MQILFSAFTITGTPTMNPSLNADAYAVATASPSSSPRSLFVQYDIVDVAGTRSDGMTLSGAQAWTGGIIAISMNPPLPTPGSFNFVASTSSVQVTATWSASSGAGHYEVEMQRSDGGGGWNAFAYINPATSPLVLGPSDGVVAGATYRARVRAMPSS